MKKLFTALLLILVSSLGFSQDYIWEWQNPKPSANDIYDVVALGSTKVLAFGYSGSMYKTTNKGINWQMSYVDTSKNDITGAYFVDTTTGFLCGDNGLIMKTTDGGQTWTYKTSGISTKLWDIEFLNKDSGFAVGGSGVILKTTDGGENWVSTIFGTGAGTHYKVSVFNNSLAYIGSSSAKDGRLIKTTDFGATWTNVTPTAIATNVYAMAPYSANTFWVAPGANGILKTTDGGTTWTTQTTTGNSIYDIEFADSLNGWAADSKGIIYYTTNSGAVWSTKTLSSAKGIRAISRNSGSFYASGTAGNIYYSEDGINYTQQSSFASQEYLRKVYFFNDSVGYACGGATSSADNLGQILKTTDGGNTWAALPFNFTAQVYSFAFPSATTWYAGTGNTKIFKTTDAGATWTQLTAPAPATSWGMKFVNVDTGYVVGSAGTMIKTTDGGATWSTLTTGIGSTSVIYAIDIIDTTVYITSQSATLKKSTDGGATWSAVTTNITGNFFTVKFKNDTVGFVGGASYSLARTTDGGATWTAMTLPSAYNIVSTTSIWSVAFGKDNDVWAVLGTGDILYSPDLGNTWSVINKVYSGALSDIFAKGNYVWAVGTSGSIIKGHKNITVPVELTTFSYTYKANKVCLNWQTATEVNNKGFEVQRKVDSNWEKIGFVTGKGTTTRTSSYSFTVNESVNGTVNYRLKQIDYDGTYKYSNIIEVSNNSVPSSFSLAQNYPNPFNPTTTIKYNIPVKASVELKVYNLLGQEVSTLVNQVQEAGQYNISFNASALSSGVYFYSIKAGSFSAQKKMMLVK